MTDEWKIEKPQILISVTGGAKSFSLKPKLRLMFANGLRKVVLLFICCYKIFSCETLINFRTAQILPPFLTLMAPRPNYIKTTDLK